MNFLTKLFAKENKPINSYASFWVWFKRNQNAFFYAVKSGKRIESDFFDYLSPKLAELKEGFFFLAGMIDEHTAELVITADGAVKNIVFVEELVSAAPAIPRWKFTALKPPTNIENIRINMGGCIFDKESLSFFSNDHKDYPDEIDITIVHKIFNEENRTSIVNGTYIFIDNFIGELNCVSTIDNLIIQSEAEAGTLNEFVPIEKLKDFLKWREKEFIEKYDGVLQHTDNAQFSIMEAVLENGNMLIATINTDILNWEYKASHPWILSVEIPYDGSKNNGMPDEDTYLLLNEVENKMLDVLKDKDGYLNIGRQTADSRREIYFACKDFRKPSKVLYQLSLEYASMHIVFDIYKDKYWRSFNRFRQESI